MLVKVLLGRWVSAMGKRVNSGSLIASGADALNDAILSASVLASALIFHFTGLSLEPYVGVVIAVFIIKAGVEMIQDAIDDMLGKRVDREFLNDIRRTVCEDEAVSGAYDLILHSYGPEKYIGSVHVEVPSTMTADEIDRMERRITAEVYRRHGVVMAGVGIYSASPANREMWDRVIQIVHDHAGVLQVHGFYADEAEKSMTFDIILDFDLPDRQAVFDHIRGDIQEAYPGWTVNMTMDIDF